MQLYTVGFTRKSAEQFFGLVQQAGVQRMIDTRLNNRSQLAGFAKRDDLRYFLEHICGVEYVEMLQLAPEAGMLAAYRADGVWDRYQGEYLNLIAKRRPERGVPKAFFERGCLLCSEHDPKRCHRRLAAEYLQRRFGDVQITHLK